MLIELSHFRSLIGNDICLSKMEIIKRYRALATVNYFLLQLLHMVPFSMMGRDENGELYWC
jgi:hypothetical protein